VLRKCLIEGKLGRKPRTLEKVSKRGLGDFGFVLGVQIVGGIMICELKSGTLKNIWRKLLNQV